MIRLDAARRRAGIALTAAKRMLPSRLNTRSFMGAILPVVSGKRGRTVELDRKANVMVMRWLVVLLVLFMAAYSTRGLELDSPSFLLAYGYVVANVLVSLFSARLFERTWFTYLLFIADIVFVSAMIYFSEGVNTDFYLIYFLAIFMSSVGRSVGGAVPVAVISSVLYGWLIFQKEGAEMFSQPSFWIRIPFFFLIALFSSFWASQVASEKRQKEEVEQFNRRLRQEVDAATAEIVRANESVKTLKEYNENILASINSGVLVVDLTGTVTTFNHAAAEIFALPAAAVVGRPPLDLPQLAPLGKLLARTMEAGVDIHRDELAVAAGDGREVPLAVSTSLLHSQTARSSGAIAVFSDLSRTKSLEERVRHSEKLAILGEMAAVMAHEIRNPLNSIAGFSQLLQMKAEEATPQRQYVDIIVHESFRIDALISDILDFAHQRKAAPADVVFAALADKVVSARSDAAKRKGVRLAAAAGRDLPPYRGDAVRLERVLLNLVNNALDATGEGGSVTVAVDRADRDGAAGVRISVADTGCGIPAEHLGNIFKPFFTTKQTGTGLGLAIIQKIVEEHEGILTVDSEPGRGTTFTIFLPLAPQASRSDGGQPADNATEARAS